MALAIDASTPAVAVSTSNTTTTVTTASFTPPANSLLLVRWSWNTSASDTPAAPSITDSLGSPLTYTLTDHKTRAAGGAVDGQCAAWWAKVTSSAAMTVTVTRGTGTNTQGGALHVTVITGHDTTNPIGAHGKSGSASASSIAQSYTASATGGQGFIVVTDWDLLGAETAGTGCTLTNGGSGSAGTEISYGFLRRTLADDANGGSNTLNVTIPGTSTNLSWVYAEVVPPSGSSLAGPPVQVVPASAQTSRIRPIVVAPTIGPPQAIPAAPVTVAAQAQIPQPRTVTVSPPQIPPTATAILPLTVLVAPQQFRPQPVPPSIAVPVLLPTGQPVPAAPFWINPSRSQPQLAAVIAIVPAPLPQAVAPIVVVTSTWRPQLPQVFASQLAFLAPAAPALAPAAIAVPRAFAARPVVRPLVLTPATLASGVCVCTTARPNSGLTTRPASGTTARPSSGITARPGSGTTTRPYAGVTARPCTCT